MTAINSISNARDAAVTFDFIEDHTRQLDMYNMALDTIGDMIQRNFNGGMPGDDLSGSDLQGLGSAVRALALGLEHHREKTAEWVCLLRQQTGQSVEGGLG